MFKLRQLAACIALSAALGIAAEPSHAAGLELPRDWEARTQNIKTLFPSPDTPFSDAAQRAINGTLYQCQSTDFTRWANGLDLTDVRAALTEIARKYGVNFANSVIEFPQYYSQLFQQERADASYGPSGAYTKVLTTEMRNLKRFWDIPSGNIQLLPMRGSDVFRDNGTLANFIGVLYGIEDQAFLNMVAGDVQQAIFSRPSLKGGDHPIFSLNAFAYAPPAEIREMFGIDDRIVMGEGIMEALSAIGLGEFGPRAVLGHEFGHQVQFDKGLFVSTLTGAEATRRTELMADSFSTYYLTHKRGATLNAKRLLPSLQVSYQIGDCNFSSSNHHGTPNQRLRAAQWGSDLAGDAQKQGHILPAMTVDALFEPQLPNFVRPDTN